MTVQLHALPWPLAWENAPTAWSSDGAALSMSAGPLTDLFTDPNGSIVVNNSPRLCCLPDAGDFQLSARVKVDFAATFDAGVLMVYGSDQLWAKFCFEFSPQRQPMIVSVVTRGWSDDCNSRVIDGNEVYLRLSRIGQAYALHYSLDSAFWHLVRYFSLGAGGHALGFSVQSPTGQGCTATFSEIVFAAATLSDLRSGE